jgi:hypothetical protein
MLFWFYQSSLKHYLNPFANLEVPGEVLVFFGGMKCYLSFSCGYVVHDIYVWSVLLYLY